MQENRQHERISVAFRCSLTVDGETRECELQDLSAGGAKVKAKGKYPIGTAVSLELDKFGSFRADVVRVEKSIIGLKFHRSADEMLEVVMGFAGLV